MSVGMALGLHLSLAALDFNQGRLHISSTGISHMASLYTPQGLSTDMSQTPKTVATMTNMRVRGHNLDPKS